jgi:2-aminoethylphosphonate-pyruvate transaminase
MTSDRDPYLLTPGPLTTSAATKQAMLHDWGSRDGRFIDLTARVRERLAAIAGGGEHHSCVLLQGSGTYVVEAMLGSLVPADGRCLILVNGAYGARMARICEIIGRDHAIYETAEDTPPVPERLDEILADDAGISHVAAVHCETTTGILNRIEDIAAVCAARGRELLVDAMSSFGALPFDFGRVPCAAVAASANKCLEGVPGVGFVVARRDVLESAAGSAPSLSLDLHHQWRGFEGTGEWRFTPPTQVLAAFDQALSEHADEGGVAGRGERYAANCRILVEGMRKLGFETFLPDALQAPIIITFRAPSDPRFEFTRFYDALAGRGYLIYPGKLTRAASFRIGCIGHLDEAVMRDVVAAVAQVTEEMQFDPASGTSSS